MSNRVRAAVAALVLAVSPIAAHASIGFPSPPPAGSSPSSAIPLRLEDDGSYEYSLTIPANSSSTNFFSLAITGAFSGSVQLTPSDNSESLDFSYGILTSGGTHTLNTGNLNFNGSSIDYAALSYTPAAGGYSGPYLILVSGVAGADPNLVVNVSPVPLPGALYLFGAAIVGLTGVGISKVRRAKAI
jgi:hypothetical protein